MLGNSGVRFNSETLESPGVGDLIAALDQYLDPLYPPEENFGELPAADLNGERCVLLVGRQAEKAVACGAIRMLSQSTAKVKRMYVVPELRGQGIARVLLAELEAWARNIGATRAVLETGARQPEALRLYERVGYRAIPCFGPYSESATSLCFERSLVEE